MNIVSSFTGYNKLYLLFFDIYNNTSIKLQCQQILFLLLIQKRKAFAALPAVKKYVTETLYPPPPPPKKKYTERKTKLEITTDKHKVLTLYNECFVLLV